MLGYSLKRRNVSPVIGHDKIHSTSRFLLFRHWGEPLLYTGSLREVAPYEKFIVLYLLGVVIREYKKCTLLKEKVHYCHLYIIEF